MDNDSFHRLVLRIARRLNVTISHARVVAELNYTSQPRRA